MSILFFQQAEDINQWDTEPVVLDETGIPQLLKANPHKYHVLYWPCKTFMFFDHVFTSYDEFLALSNRIRSHQHEPVVIQMTCFLYFDLVVSSLKIPLEPRILHS